MTHLANQIEVTVIIVNFNTKELLKNCLDSIRLHTQEIKYEVIVVDNDSKDGSQDEIPHIYPWIKWIETGKNLGFGGANNLGFQFASGKNIFLLNSDTVLANNAIKILSDYLNTHPKVGCVGGQLYDKNDNLAHSYKLFFPSILSELDSLLMGSLTWCKLKLKKILTNNQGYNVCYITGADLMIRKEDILEYGFFDLDFFMYYEETDLCYRLFKAKKKAFFVPQSKIYHFEGSSFKVKESRELLYAKSRNIFYKKHRSPIEHSIANLIFRVNCRIKSKVFHILGKKNKSQNWEIKLKSHYAV